MRLSGNSRNSKNFKTVGNPKNILGILTPTVMSATTACQFSDRIHFWLRKISFGLAGASGTFGIVFRSTSSYRISPCRSTDRNLRPRNLLDHEWPGRTMDNPPAKWPGETRLQNQSGLNSGFLAFNLMSNECLCLESVIQSSTSTGSPSSWSSRKSIRAAVSISLALRVQQEPLHRIFWKSCPRNFFKNRVWGNFSKIIITRNSKIPNIVPNVRFPLSPVWMCRLWKRFCRLVATVSESRSTSWCLQISDHEFFQKSCPTWSGLHSGQAHRQEHLSPRCMDVCADPRIPGSIGIPMPHPRSRRDSWFDFRYLSKGLKHWSSSTGSSGPYIEMSPVWSEWFLEALSMSVFIYHFSQKPKGVVLPMDLSWSRRSRNSKSSVLPEFFQKSYPQGPESKFFENYKDPMEIQSHRVEF